MIRRTCTNPGDGAITDRCHRSRTNPGTYPYSVESRLHRFHEPRVTSRRWLTHRFPCINNRHGPLQIEPLRLAKIRIATKDSTLPESRNDLSQLGLASVAGLGATIKMRRCHTYITERTDQIGQMKNATKNGIGQRHFCVRHNSIRLSDRNDFKCLAPGAVRWHHRVPASLQVRLHVRTKGMRSYFLEADYVGRNPRLRSLGYLVERGADNCGEHANFGSFVEVAVIESIDVPRKKLHGPCLAEMPNAGRPTKVAGMDLRIFVEPQQGASYDTLLAVAQTTEKSGFDAFFRSDHYLKMGAVSGLPGPTDTWVTMAGLARETTRIKLGTLVTSATFRHPGPLAVSVAQVDQMSGGRVELGLGAGWYEAEHLAFSIPFAPLGERFERFEDQLAILRGMWDPAVSYDKPFSYTGKHHSVVDAPGLPKPVGAVPIIIGGGGPKRTPRLAATYAAEFNTPFRSAAQAKEHFATVSKACEAIGRDPKTMILSSAQVIVCANSNAELERRAKAIGREVEDLRTNGLWGTAEEIADQLKAYREAGATRAYVQILDLSDLEHIEQIGEQLIPLVRDL